MLLYLITYQNKKLELKHRIIKNLNTDLKIGDVTPMGWYVLDIQIFYKNRFYTYSEYQKVKKHLPKNKILKRLKILFLKDYKN